MGKMKAGIFSMYMNNISPEVVEKQAAVVKKFNVSNHDFYQVLTNRRHGDSMDLIWSMNAHDARHGNKQFDYNVIMFLDIDAVPVNEYAIDSYIQQAYDGDLVGNMQRTNHLQNGQHVFAAPSAMAISVESFDRIGRPSANETPRSDVGEEYTWLAERSRIPVVMCKPLRYDLNPKEAPGGWNLADGMPKYGIGTTFGYDAPGHEANETFYHTFQIRFPEHHQLFIQKCDSLLKG